MDAAHMLASVVPPRPGGPLRVAEQSEQPRAQRWLGSLHNNIGLDPLRHNARKPWNNSSGLYPCDADKAMRRLSALRSGRLPRRSSVPHHRGTPADAATSLQDEGKSDGYVFARNWLSTCSLWGNAKRRRRTRPPSLVPSTTTPTALQVN